MNDIDDITDASEELWQLLSDKERLFLFAAVVRRIYQGEILEGRSYRGVLYDIFNFGPESYMIAQYSGFLDLHNAILSKQYITTLFTEFSSKKGFVVSEEEIENFLTEKNIK